MDAVLLRGASLSRRAARVLPFALVVGLYFAARVHYLGSALGGLSTAHFGDGQVVTYSLASYLRLDPERLRAIFVSVPQVLLYPPLHQGRAVPWTGFCVGLGWVVMLGTVPLRAGLRGPVVVVLATCTLVAILPAVFYFPPGDPYFGPVTVKRFYICGVFLAPLIALLVAGDVRTLGGAALRAPVLGLLCGLYVVWGKHYAVPWLEFGRDSRDYIDAFGALSPAPPRGATLYATGSSPYDFLERVQEHHDTAAGYGFYAVAQVGCDLDLLGPEGHFPGLPVDSLCIGDGAHVYHWDEEGRALHDLTEAVVGALGARADRRAEGAFRPEVVDPGWRGRDGRGAPGDTLEIEGEWSLDGGRLGPLAWCADSLAITLEARGETAVPAGNHWAGELRYTDGAGGTARLCVEIATDGEARRYTLPVGHSISWLLTPRIDDLQLYLEPREDAGPLRLVLGGVEFL